MLTLTPLTLEQANELIGRLHRHHKSVVGHRFSVGAWQGEKLVGVATVGRPVAQLTPQYQTADVTRNCTDGTKNACSFLYSACARIAKEMGFVKIQTFILESEPGTSLRAAGWTFDGMTRGGSHTRVNRKRREDQPQCKKQRWVKNLKPWPTPPSAPTATRNSIAPKGAR